MIKSQTNNNAGVQFDDIPLRGTIVAPIPEPATATLALLGVAGLARRRRRVA